MARILIGNIKGPQGDRGQQGERGPQGAQGVPGTTPALVNNALATQAGVAALDAVMGKTLSDKIGQVFQNRSIFIYGHWHKLLHVKFMYFQYVCIPYAFGKDF